MLKSKIRIVKGGPSNLDRCLARVAVSQVGIHAAASVSYGLKNRVFVLARFCLKLNKFYLPILRAKAH